MTNTATNPTPFIARAIAAAGLTLGLLLFLTFMRLQGSSDAPLQTLSTLNTAPPVSLPAPPPPPQTTPPPPEVQPKQLPKLQIELESVAPPVKAKLSDDIELQLDRPEFASKTAPVRTRMTFSSSELDSSPRLMNRPSVTFPKSQSRRGITEGKATLEVMITSAGSVQVRRVISSDHEDFTKMARAFATQARFTPPKKDGRAVNALFRWPLILRL